MSHFVCLVIGENVEKQLAPFDENIDMPEYKKGPVSDEDKQQMLEYYARNKGFVGSIEECNELYGKDWNDSSYKLDENGVLCEYSTYNPKSKWDWWTIGGRWSGYFKPKEGASGFVGVPGVMNNEPKAGYVDMLLKGDIDFDYMYAEAEKKAAEKYDKFYEIVKDTEIPESWVSVRERFGLDKINEAREFYNSQERVVKYNTVDPWQNIDEYNIPKEEFVRIARESTLIPLAIVYNGEWIERGEMGWFGISVNEKDQNVWNAQVTKLLNELPDDTMITAVDCHI